MIRTAFALSACLALTAAAAGCYSGGNNCFPAGTLIQTPAGDVRVETLKIGDEVLAFDLATGKEVRTQVVKTYVHAHDPVLERLTFADGSVLEATPEHPLFSRTRRDWAKAGSLAPGEELAMRDGQGAVVAVALTARDEEKNLAGDVYNLQTAAGNYFAGNVLAKYY